MTQSGYYILEQLATKYRTLGFNLCKCIRCSSSESNVNTMHLAGLSM